MLTKWRSIRTTAALGLLLWPAVASANLLQSSHFRLDPNVAANFGGAGSSASYKLTDTGGEGVVGAGSSASYRLGQGYVRQLPHSLQLAVLPSGTYAAWPLDTGNGLQAYDVGANRDDGTLVNAPAWTTGIVGQAVALNGSTQYISTANQVAAPAALTLEAWFKTTTVTGGYLAGLGDTQTGASTTHDRVLYLTNTGQVAFGVNPGTIKTVTTAASFNDGSWHHAAGVWGSGGLRLYIDGVLRGNYGTATTAGSYSGYWRLGFDTLTGWPGAPTSSFLAGSLDEARVYSRELSAAEVAGDYTAGANALKGAFTLPNVTPGQSQTYAADAIVRTDAAGYDLYIQSAGLLTHTDGTTTIPAVGANIATPAAWSEGVTKGLGFTVTAGTQLEAKWGTSPNFAYAAVPGLPTIYHTRTDTNGAAADTTSLQYRADTAPSQKQGTYKATIIYTATMRP